MCRCDTVLEGSEVNNDLVAVTDEIRRASARHEVGLCVCNSPEDFWLCGDDVVLDGVLDEVGAALGTHDFHDPVFVKGHRSGRHV